MMQILKHMSPDLESAVSRQRTLISTGCNSNPPITVGELKYFPLSILRLAKRKIRHARMLEFFDDDSER
jgi:hypothetical protein